jgi:hypothetical protein
MSLIPWMMCYLTFSYGKKMMNVQKCFFLRSLLPDMKKMNPAQQYHFRVSTLKTIGEILYGTEQQITLHQGPSTSFLLNYQQQPLQHAMPHIMSSNQPAYRTPGSTTSYSSSLVSDANSPGSDLFDL